MNDERPPTARRLPPTEERRLWRRYARRRTAKLRNELVEKYLWLPTSIARLLASRRDFPADVDTETLVSAGRLGLIWAVEHFDHTLGFAFTTYANKRVRGAMLDELREMDFQSRSTRNMQRRRREIEAALAQQFGRPATDEEIAAAADWDAKQLQRSRPEQIASLFTPIYEGRGRTIVLGDLLEGVLKKEDRSWFEPLTRGLPIEERIILYLQNVQGYTLKQIGGILKLSESRISQIRTEALNFLREHQTR